jgi:nucleotide-binding universal stress UspA family protein
MRVLIATDFSPHAEDAVKIVRGMPLPSGSTVRVLHAIEPFAEVATLNPVAINTFAETAMAQVNSELDVIAARLGAPGCVVETISVLGRVADAIVEEAERAKADLIVMGSRGHRAVTSALLGSVSAEVVDRAPCPVLIARGPSLRTVILAEDGSETADAGARLLSALPALSRLEVRVVSVIDAPFPSLLVGTDAPMATYAAVQAYSESLPALRDATAKIAHDRAAALTAAGIAATSEVREGDAAAQLIAAATAARADCIVIGTHGRTGVARLFLGSVARGVLFNAPCSVLIVRGVTVAHARREKAVASSS